MQAVNLNITSNLTKLLSIQIIWINYDKNLNIVKTIERKKSNF